MRGWIVAMGGRTVASNGERSPLDDHVLARARARRGEDRPRMYFIGTASGDDAGDIARCHAAVDPVAGAAHPASSSRTVEDRLPARVLP